MKYVIAFFGALILLGGVSGYLAVAATGQLNGDLVPGHPVCGGAQNSMQDCSTVGTITLAVGSTNGLLIKSGGIVTLSQTSGNAAAKFVCIDSANAVVLQSSACQ